MADFKREAVKMAQLSNIGMPGGAVGQGLRCSVDVVPSDSHLQMAEKSACDHAATQTAGIRAMRDFDRRGVRSLRTRAQMPGMLSQTAGHDQLEHARSLKEQFVSTSTYISISI
tara:strand:- start:804 stop:1145 length:342 start_codon:yes stop_codon:yes gene_type:complete